MRDHRILPPHAPTRWGFGPKRGDRRGAVLLLAFVMMIVLLILVTSFVFTVSIESTIADNRRMDVATMWAARGGLTLGTCFLELDEQNAFDSLNEPWAKPISDRKIGDARVKIEVVDEERKFNILALNTDNEDQLQWAKEVLTRLIRLARNEHNNEPLRSGELGAPAIVENIVEWIKDTDAGGNQNTSLSEGPKSGQGDADNFDNDDVKINKSSPHPIITTAELMQIKGVTRELLYGPAKKTLPTVQTQRPGELPPVEEPQRQGLLNFITCYSAFSTRVNINTAPKEVLRALDEKLFEDELLVQAILDARIKATEDEESAEGEDADEDTASFRRGDISNYARFAAKLENEDFPEEVFTRIRPRLAVRSRHFTVVSTAFSGAGDDAQSAQEAAKQGRIVQTWRALYVRTREGDNYKLTLLILDKEES